MLQKWKNILTNWINCYFIESDSVDTYITVDLLLNIISHLRENLSLDESKSSVLEAHTVEEFLQEKYPAFCFVNGTVEASSEDDLYMVLSLLLFFVCVNSKDIDIKSAMCSKLSTDDQEVILKFSKCLLECTPIMYKDIHNAIIEACNPSTVLNEQGSTHQLVLETPPALRSLHGEVRRLQAALEAERFDRNYLQEELARTNLQVEKLSKDKEKYKLDIVNLKAKISMCCGQESEAKPGDKVAEGTAKLMKELQQTEERLVETQGQLDEALYERDAYKVKVNELKQERDKWVSLSQQDAARVIELSEQLSVERRNVQSLKELVEELRQHHQLNQLDGSLLECDNPDVSVHSLHNNTSICSEACANVVEVQLSEERAKIVLLKQQIQSFQKQLNELTQKSESEIQSLNTIVSEKDNDIFNLKHRINEEIEAKNKIVIQYSDENSRLNNEINALEQKIKDNDNQYRLVIETKMQDIQILQEEKLSLLQSLNDETTKLEKIINNLKSELATEKDAKSKMKEYYENHLMKLNEKVNELKQECDKWVSLSQQDAARVVELSEQLSVEQRNVQSLKELVEELRQHHQLNRLDGSLLECDDPDVSVHSLHHNTSICSEACANVVEVQLSEERAKIVLLKQQIQSFQEQLNDLAHKSESEIQSLNTIVSEKDNDIFNLKHRINEEIEAKNKILIQYSDENSRLNNEINALEQKIKDNDNQYRLVIETKMQDIQILQEEKLSLLQSLNDETTKLEKIINNLKSELATEKDAKSKMKEYYENHLMKLNEKVNELKQECDKWVSLSQQDAARVVELSEQLSVEQRNVQSLKELVEELRQHHQLNRLDGSLLECDDPDVSVHSLHHNTSICSEACANVVEVQLSEERAKIVLLKQQIQSFQEQLNDLTQKSESEIQSLNTIVSEKDNDIFNLKHRINEEIEAKNKIVIQYSDENSRLNNEINALEQKIKDNDNQYRLVIETKMQDIQILQEEKLSLLQSLNDETTKLEKIINNLKSELATEKDAKSKMKEYYENHLMKLNEKVGNRNNELVEVQNNVFEKSEQIETLRMELRNEKQTKDEIEEKYHSELQFINTRKKEAENMIEQKEEEIKSLMDRLTNNYVYTEELNRELNFIKESLSQPSEYQIKAEKQLEEQQKEITVLQEEIRMLQSKINDNEKDLKEKDDCINTKDALIGSVQQELKEEKANKAILQIELGIKESMLSELKQKVNEAHSDDVFKALRNEEWLKAVGQRDMYAVAGTDKFASYKYASPIERDYRDFHYQVDNTTSDLTHSSMDSIKTISDLEKIIHDKNRTITALQSDVTYLKSLIADSENKLLDVSKDLEVSKENCQQLSNQLKKIVHQKNEEIADLKRQVSKMSVTENRASQIIKVSAKYQAIILKRISEIKSNVVLKELTNFGNASNGDNELRRSLNVGTITMEDLENFLETTDKHLRRCSEKQIMLQKERDRLAEVNRINESEIINMRKFLTELSVSFKTFGNLKDLYTQKLSRVISVQRTVRREILSLDGRINDTTMCKLERGYSAIIQDLTECVMNLERWVEKSITRTISAEKIKRAFSKDDERASLSSTTFQNVSLEVQLDELDNSFQKLLEEIVRAQKGEGAKDAQSVTVMEIRAEYEDKLNRMKAKMRELLQSEVSAYKERQKHEITVLERELLKTREKLAESSKAYEEHIKSLTTELWRVGEKFLSKKDELEWERKKQRSGSLMSLQHVHSSGLVPPKEESSRISGGHSLRSLPIHDSTNKREGRGLHMSDEEGEVFDNRWLRELSATPRASRASPAPARLSELRWRNSLCPPHLKSSYPAETQFAPALDEEDIKSIGAVSLGGRNQRKEVGITAYKKPGPPTPSKQAGRLSATDSELRESLRPEPEPQVSRKTSTPSRLRSLFRSNKNYTAEGTPRSRRLSIFRKKL